MLYALKIIAEADFQDVKTGSSKWQEPEMSFERERLFSKGKPSQAFSMRTSED